MTSPQSHCHTRVQSIVDERSRLKSVTITTPLPLQKYDLSLIAHYILELYRCDAEPCYVDRDVEHAELVLRLDTDVCNFLEEQEGATPGSLTWVVSRKQENPFLEALPL